MKKEKDQIKLLQDAKKALGYSNEQLGAAIGKSEDAIKSWLASASAAKRRTMPAGSRLLLKRILAEHKAARGKR